MEEDVIGRACGRRGENRIGFGSGKPDPRDHVENLNVGGTFVLKLILEVDWIHLVSAQRLVPSCC